MTQTTNDKVISISLFAGAFGLDLGMEQAGFHTVNVVESEEIDACCDRITNEFIKKHGSGSQGVDNYIKDIF